MKTTRLFNVSVLPERSGIIFQEEIVLPCKGADTPIQVLDVTIYNKNVGGQAFLIEGTKLMHSRGIDISGLVSREVPREEAADAALGMVLRNVTHGDVTRRDLKTFP